MPQKAILDEFRKKVGEELRGNILPFWLEKSPDVEFGGFYGRISYDLRIDRQAPKGLILNSRILWTFARAYRSHPEPKFLQAAQRAYNYLLQFFRDPDFGGYYWMVDHLGRPLDSRKKIYGQAFTIYALAEFYLATGSEDCLHEAVRLFEQVEQAAHDAEFGGYFETYNSDWTLAADQRLSEVDMDEKKSMNTHLHVLEAYTNLLRASHEDLLHGRLRDLVLIFLFHIIDPHSHHFRLFFDETWRCRSERISFGHDIEGSWLSCEAASVLGDREVKQRVEEISLQIADAVRVEGIDADGGLFQEAGPRGIIDTDKHWWPQAEAVVGFLNAYNLSGREDFFTASYNSWNFIEKHLVDREFGEWFWSVSREGTPDREKFKVDPWKCPYHNSRMCFEVMERLR
jgi:mannobiose 2-epimerase